MPELPEVETIRRGLEKKIIGLTIHKVGVLNSKTFFGDPQILWGKKVLKVWRKAKMLGIDLTGDLSIVFHLKMTGQLIYIGNRQQATGDRLIGGHPTSDMKGQMPNSSTRVIFEFIDPRGEISEGKLYFNDQRKFGWVKLVQSSKIKDQKFLQNLGPEPLEKEFSWEILKNNLLRHKNLPIKVALMDQSVVSGIGNIYASEVLFLARVDPRKKVAALSDKEFEKIYQGIKKSLEVAIEKGGSTRAHFVNIEGERGYFLDYANVYGKEGQKCHGCPGKVEKITQAGRGTYFCPSCQK